MFTSRSSVKPVLLAGIAAAAYYAYSRMSDEQKKNIVDTLKNQGRDLLKQLFPTGNSTDQTPAAGQQV